MGEREDFKFGTEVDCSYSQPMDDKPSLKRVCLFQATQFKFGGPIHISGMAEARAVKFCTQGDYIKSCQKDDKSPPKEVWLGSRDPFFMRNCEL